MGHNLAGFEWPFLRSARRSVLIVLQLCSIDPRTCEVIQLRVQRYSGFIIVFFSCDALQSQQFTLAPTDQRQFRDTARDTAVLSALSLVTE